MFSEKLQHIISELPVTIQKVIEMVIAYFTKEIAVKDARIKELENQLSKNSTNSSKPPSSDAPYKKPEPKSLREKTGKKAGGQKGHKGETLKMSETIDHKVVHEVNICECCGVDLSKKATDYIHRRQVFDIPPPIKIEVTEHQAEEKKCLCGKVNRAVFPENVSHYVQYGPRIKGMMVYLQDYQLLPSARTAELIFDLFGHKISEGTLFNTRKYAYTQLEDFESGLKLLLTAATIAGFDETGLRVLSKCWWLHSCSTEKHAYYEVHQKRGKEAMDDIGILPDFNGIAIHDFWRSYLGYNCTHGLCNAHLLRELTFLEEQCGQKWARELADLIIQMKKAKEQAIAEGKTALSDQIIHEYEVKYDDIVQKGLEINPFEPPPETEKKKRGRVAKSKARNLLERLRDYKSYILRFFNDFRVPFDNNFSERDIRIMKLKQKISGCFRSFKGAQYFARIRSYIMTARKQNTSCFNALVNLFEQNNIYIELLT